MIRKAALSVLLGAASVAATMVTHGAVAAEITSSRQPQVAQYDSGPAQLTVADGGRRPGRGGPGGFIDCPPGHTPQPFDMPVYDDEGLFVVGHETVWFCIPDDLEPAG